MPTPHGFVEVHSIDVTPFLSPEHFRDGTIVKYLRTREAVDVDDNEDAQLRKFITSTGTGVMVHEFRSRGGQGLSFKLRGAPSLDSKLCAVQAGWVMWLHYQPNREWALALPSDLRIMREMMFKNVEADNALDATIGELAGSWRPKWATKLREEAARVSLGPLNEPPKERAPEDDPEILLRAMARLRTLMSHGQRMLNEVRRMMFADGFTLPVITRACEELGVQFGVTKRGRRNCQYMQLPPEDGTPVTVTTAGVRSIRAALQRDIAAGEEPATSARMVWDDGPLDLGELDPSIEADDEEDGSTLDDDEDGQLEELFRRYRGNDTLASNAPDARSESAHEGEPGPMAMLDQEIDALLRRPSTVLRNVEDDDDDGGAEIDLDELVKRPLKVKAPDPQHRGCRVLADDNPACVKLRELLAAGPRPVEEVTSTMGAAGFGNYVVRAARSTVGAKTRMVGARNGRKAFWELYLPSAGPLALAGD